MINFVNLQKFHIMAAEKFRFKQFEIMQDRCAMKVGTDGVLLGAWAAITAAAETKRVLDVGTGTGLIALMLAQKLEGANVVGIDIDEQAVEQARMNINNSQWADRMSIVQTSLQDYLPEEMFDIIVSNPPFFIDSLKNPDARRSIARHTETLSMDELAKHTARLLKENGYLFLVLSPEAYKQFQRTSVIYGLREETIIGVRSKAGKPVKRYMIVYRNNTDNINYSENREEVIMDDAGRYSDWYKALTEDFYL